MDKKLVLTLLMMLFTIASNAQSLVDYQPVISQSELANSETEEAYAYIRTSNGFQRMRIRISYVRNGTYPIVSAYIPPKQKSMFHSYTPSNGTPWVRSNAPIKEVSQYDSDYIYRNFDYKAHINGLGDIYF